MQQPPASPPSQPGRTPTAPSPAVRQVDSTVLLQGARVLEIMHSGEVYRLQTTRAGKLILTK